MKRNWRRVIAVVVVVGLGLGIFLFVMCNQKKQEEKMTTSLGETKQRLAMHELQDFLISRGKLVELFYETDSEDGVPIVVTETGGIPIYEKKDKAEAMSDFPVILYYPNSNKVRLHFEMDLSARFETWELYMGEKLVPPDPEKEYYYFLDLEKEGMYIMDYTMEIRYPDPNTGEESHIYFSIAW